MILSALRQNPICGETRYLLAKFLLTKENKASGKVAQALVNTYIEVMNEDDNKHDKYVKVFKIFLKKLIFLRYFTFSLSGVRND